MVIEIEFMPAKEVPSIASVRREEIPAGGGWDRG